MKNGSTLLLLGLTILFVGLTAGILVGRHIGSEPATIRISSDILTDTSDPTATEPFHSAEQLININKASVMVLDTLPGIGTVLAQRIVDYRQANGPFKDVSELAGVEGIGAEKLLAILDLITVED